MRVTIIKHYIYFLITLTVIVSFIVHTASADYDFDGVPLRDQLKNIAHGSVTGGVYVDGGHGVGDAKNSPYSQSFNIPEGQIIYSRLYVGVWGGTETKTGTLQITFNDHDFDTLDLEGKVDSNENVYCSGHGVYWVVYDTTQYTSSGSNLAEALTSGSYDGRVYGIVLAAVYENNNSEQEVEYWINEGNPNLHSSSDAHPSENKEAFAYFSGITDIYPPAARLTVVYLTGDEGQNDYLYFNDNKLNGDDVAASRNSFDLLTFDVTDHLEKSSNAKFEVGDETYLHPVLSVLTVYTGDLIEESDLVIKELAIPELCTEDENIITVTIENIGTSPAFGFSAALYCDDEMVSKAQVSSINSGDNLSVNFSWEPEYTGLHVLRVMADYTDLISELRETNNNNTPFTVNILDRSPPNITISKPQYDQIFTTDIITTQGSIEDTDNNITVLVNGINASYTGSKWKVQVPLEQGMNKIIVDAVDGSNNTATEFVIVFCDYNGPVYNANTSSGGMGIDTHENSGESTDPQIKNSSSVFTLTFIGAGSLICLIMVIYLIRRRT